MNDKTNQKSADKNTAESNVKRSDSSANKSRNLWLFAGIIVFAVLVGTIVYYSSNKQFEEKFNQVSSLNENLYENLAQRDSLIDEWMQTFMKIEEDLLTMQEKEDFLVSKSFDPEFSGEVRERILNEIQQLNALLSENKNKITSLNKKLKNSGVKIASLQTKVNSLEKSLAARDSSIVELKMQLVDRDFMLGELNVLISELDSNIAEANEKLSEQNTKLNKAYFASGNYKELEERGLVTREGGFLGIGGSKTLETNFPEDQFREINISEIDLIVLNAKKAEVISDHPSDSYEIINTDSLVSYIEITDPEEFWKITRYAVVETKD